MTIKFTLNGGEVTARVDAEVRLIDVLRDDFNQRRARAGCRAGVCGACSVLLGGKAVKACLVPAFKVRGREVVTLEGFAATDEYRDIARGFAEAGAEPCGYCEAGKILAAEALLARNMQPSKREVLAAFQGVRCRCTEPESLARAVFAAAETRRRRLYGRG